MANYLEWILYIQSHTKTNSDSFNNTSLDCKGLVLGAGCNVILENLYFCLIEPGDAVLIPTPYYTAFEFEYVARAGQWDIILQV